MNATTYQIHLDHFEGPFDLLLFFIERDEIDIYDIPISKITKDFLDYLHGLERMQIEIASEFIYMAATLVKIKTHMLIPRPTTENTEEVQDPRHELVQQLVAYKQFKQAQQHLQQLEEEATKIFPSGTLTAIHDHKPQDELHSVTLYQLMTVYKKILENQKLREQKPRHVIQPYPYTPEQVKAFIVQQIHTFGTIDFLTFVSLKPDRLFIVFSILSILEMVQYQQIRVIIGDGFNNFWITSYTHSSAVEVGVSV